MSRSSRTGVSWETFQFPSIYPYPTKTNVKVLLGKPPTACIKVFSKSLKRMKVKWSEKESVKAASNYRCAHFFSQPAVFPSCSLTEQSMHTLIYTPLTLQHVPCHQSVVFSTAQESLLIMVKVFDAVTFPHLLYYFWIQKVWHQTLPPIF